jgi:hypothetical protein
VTPPLRPRQIKSELDALLATLIERGIGDDTNFSILRQSGKAWEVTFTGAEHVAIAMNDVEYSEIYGELEEKRSYNVKLIDGGLLQLMYAFDGDQLLQHRLAYFPSPRLRSFRDDPDAYLRDDLYLDVVKRRMVPFPLRFDFDDRVGIHVDMTHPRSHMTIGDVEGCRIPVTSGVTPRWFFEFVLRNFYQTGDHDFLSGLPAHAIDMPSSITHAERRLIHIAIPALA